MVMCRREDGTFISPGAWGNIWGDLVELKHDQPETWDYLAGVFLTWCERESTGSAVMPATWLPLTAWQYIIARVREGPSPTPCFCSKAWGVPGKPLRRCSPKVACSGPTQNFSGIPSAFRAGLPSALHSPKPTGGHYWFTTVKPMTTRGSPPKEKPGPLLRNQLCALTSTQGAFGFTCGVEWLATEKIIVHECTGLNWGAEENIVHAMARLGRLLNHHPCFLTEPPCSSAPSPSPPNLPASTSEPGGRSCPVDSHQYRCHAIPTGHSRDLSVSEPLPSSGLRLDAGRKPGAVD